MPELTDLTSIAAGHDNAGGLALITSLSASSIPFIETLSVPKPTYGNLRTKANAAPGYDGFKSIQWTSGLLWLPQFALLRSTYEGLVTIKSPFEGVTWANYNAILTIGNISEYEVVNETRYGFAIVNFVWRFTKVQAI